MSFQVDLSRLHFFSVYTFSKPLDVEKTADPPRDTAMPVTALHIQQKQSYLKNINIHVYKKNTWNEEFV